MHHNHHYRHDWLLGTIVGSVNCFLIHRLRSHPSNLYEFHLQRMTRLRVSATIPALLTSRPSHTSLSKQNPRTWKVDIPNLLCINMNTFVWCMDMAKYAAISTAAVALTVNDIAVRRESCQAMCIWCSCRYQLKYIRHHDFSVKMEIKMWWVFHKIGANFHC